MSCGGCGNITLFGGKDGKTIHNGEGSPNLGNPNNGDFWIDTDNWIIYGPYNNGSWGEGSSIVGATGPQGPQGPAGSSATTILRSEALDNIGMRAEPQNFLMSEPPLTLPIGTTVIINSEDLTHYLIGTIVSYNTTFNSVSIDVKWVSNPGALKNLVWIINYSPVLLPEPRYKPIKAEQSGSIMLGNYQQIGLDFDASPGTAEYYLESISRMYNNISQQTQQDRDLSDIEYLGTGPIPYVSDGYETHVVHLLWRFLMAIHQVGFSKPIVPCRLLSPLYYIHLNNIIDSSPRQSSLGTIEIDYGRDIEIVGNPSLDRPYGDVPVFHNCIANIEFNQRFSDFRLVPRKFKIHFWVRQYINNDGTLNNLEELEITSVIFR